MKTNLLIKNDISKSIGIELNHLFIEFTDDKLFNKFLKVFSESSNKINKKEDENETEQDKIKYINIKYQRKND